MKHLQKFELFEGKAFKATATKDKKKSWDADQKEAFRDKVKSHVKSQDAKTKQVGDDLEIHCGDKHIAQVMFRNDYVGVKKQGVKFTDEFEYTEFGKIKSKLTEIIKGCK
jgi:ribosomal protein S19